MSKKSTLYINVMGILSFLKIQNQTLNVTEMTKTWWEKFAKMMKNIVKNGQNLVTVMIQFMGLL